jgi:hypothetical protein
VNGGTLTDNKLNAECLAIKTVKPIVKGILKDIIFLSCAANYDLGLIIKCIYDISIL